MDEARIELFTQENPQRPLVYRNVVKGIDCQAGVQGPVSVSDFFGQTIGEDCWARVVAMCSGEKRQGEDRLWLLEGLTDTGWSDLPHGSPQDLITGIRAIERVKAKANEGAKIPDNQEIEWKVKDGEIAFLTSEPVTPGDQPQTGQSIKAKFADKVKVTAKNKAAETEISVGGQVTINIFTPGDTTPQSQTETKKRIISLAVKAPQIVQKWTTIPYGSPDQLKFKAFLLGREHTHEYAFFYKPKPVGGEAPPATAIATSADNAQAWVTRTVSREGMGRKVGNAMAIPGKLAACIFPLALAEGKYEIALCWKEGDQKMPATAIEAVDVVGAHLETTDNKRGMLTFVEENRRRHGILPLSGYADENAAAAGPIIDTWKAQPNVEQEL
ncbi:MAG: hypothetical protein N3A66_01805, partial [Planctomycetota bacterium]|nr:hypothetical protein [Planctomycetota bacterium]